MDFIIATNNAHKLEEISRILDGLGITARAPRELGVDLGTVEETGVTFAENAEIKARSACMLSGLPAIADDSGLVIDALGGEPGIYSSRYGGEELPYSGKFNIIFDKLKGVPYEKRTARFVCSMCVFLPTGEILRAQGTCEGHIGFEPLGEGGFGYDPIFMVGERSMAQLSDGEKDAVSHRGRALCVLAEELPRFIKESGHHADE